MKKIIFVMLVLFSQASVANGIYPIQLAKYHYSGQPRSITYNVQCLSDESAASYTQIYNEEGYLISEGANNRFESKKFHSLAADTDITIEYHAGNIKIYDQNELMSMAMKLILPMMLLILILFRNQRMPKQLINI